jgi:hypothetical protein
LEREYNREKIKGEKNEEEKKGAKIIIIILKNIITVVTE